VLAAQEIATVDSDKAQKQAERNFKKDERDKDGRKAMTEYEAEGRGHSREDRTFESTPIS
jgi:hypothetical protein